MYAFEDLESVHNALNLLAKREPPLMKVLPRQPGMKESRYAHLLSPVEETTAPAHANGDYPIPAAAKSDRIDALEAEIGELRTDVAELKEQFARFRKQFE